MRVLLTSNASYVPPRGGSTRGNRVWLEYLATRGHRCRVVCSAAPAADQAAIEQVREESARQGFNLEPGREHSALTLPDGTEVSLYRDLSRRTGALSAEIRAFRPDWVLVSSEDLGHSLLREADEAAPGRIVYLAHTPQFLPFGPESWSPDAHSAKRVSNAAAVVVISRHMAAYVARHGNAKPVLVHPAIYGNGPFETYSNFSLGTVLMVNPCAVKGISIFRDLAGLLPRVSFLALGGWGTTSEDRKCLATFPNVTLLEPVPRIERILEQTSLLLMPSLWHEGFGLIVMEAMLRGIPVVSSDSGGLVEAKQGTSYVLPVEPIDRFLPEFDEVRMPRPLIPPQNIAPWKEAVSALMQNRLEYERESESSRNAALDFVYSIKPSAIEDLLLSLRPKDSAPQSDLASRLERLSPDQKALLLANLRKRGRA